ncbi:MAG TPA: hypothetical protein VN048_20045 [Verrucomicrobiae bacterium]|nr:hypothetical protein [Verrucomicrobiae bacterium]
MKRILTIAMLFGAAHLASAGSTNIYVENWGTGNAISTVAQVGWTGVAGSAPAFTSGPYLGVYANSDGPIDAGTGAPLPVNTVYFTTLTTPNQVGPGMFYTTDTGGAGAGGNSSFTDINPVGLTNLSLNVEVSGGNNATNYFAVLVGGQWYVSATPIVGRGAGGDGVFTNASMAYTNLASAWNVLTVGTTNVTIGSTPGANLSGVIQGVGIVELPTSGGWDYNVFSVSIFAPNPPPPVPATITAAPISQTVYAGGGAQFSMSAAGTAPITYTWQTNSVTLVNGSKYAGATTNFLTISNCTSADAAASYSVSVTNVGGGQTNSSFTLTVNPVPAGWLYAETYPYVGPGGNLPLTGVGWANASGAAGTVVGIFQSGTGLGAVFDYSPSAGTNLNYTTDTNDTGFSGLPFVDINPASVPAVTFQAQFSPGNGAGQVSGAITAYWAVQMTGGLWYSSAKPIPISIVSQNNYLLDQLAFKTAATNWNNLTISGGIPSIGSQASGALTGDITGAGIIIIHNDTTGASMNWENFAITTNAVTQLAPVINSAIGLYNQSVATGGGASFAVATSAGSLPLTYIWTLNGVVLTNGGRISGATSPTLTIGKTTLADSDNISSPAGNIVAIVTNSIGSDRSDNYFPLSLFVTNALVGQLYFEHFPYVGPSGNQPISLDGWTEAVSGTPNVVFESVNLTGEGAAFAFQGSAATTVYYTTTANDTNQAGLQFPNINPAFYPGMTFSVDIAPSFAPTNITAYFAVEIGANWYVSASALPVPGVTSGTYSTYTQVFNPAAAGWKNLTITGSGGIIGSTASANLTGVMTGAGLVFVNTGSATFNFDNFAINGTGLGGINLGPLAGGNQTLSWVGNPAVNLQSTTSLTTPSWTDVPNTLGAYSISAAVAGPQKYFRLVEH